MNSIYLDVLKAMQNADEIEGLGFDDYIVLMHKIAEEAQARARLATYQLIESLK